MGFTQRVTVFFERSVFAPFLFSIQPVLQLFLINVDELAFSETFRAISAAFLVGCVVFGLFYLLLRDRLKAALIASP
ncbi:MAG: hypothetical protein R3307_10315, partial [Anaerolineales bacterium]|nr:hypothetical protein [Anaerolineales bacterium]